MTRKATPNSSIEELEGVRWPEPDFDSHLVRECHGHLEADPLVAGDFYPGDLLCAVLGNDEIPAKAIRKAHDRFLANG